MLFHKNLLSNLLKILAANVKKEKTIVNRKFDMILIKIYIFDFHLFPQKRLLMSKYKHAQVNGEMVKLFFEK